MTSSPFTIRGLIELDHAYIVDSWVSSYRWHPTSVDMRERYRADAKWMVRELLKRCEVRVACVANDPETIVGYCVWSKHGVHYVLTKTGFTRMGIAKVLLSPWLDKPTQFAARPYQNVPIPKGWEYVPMINVRALVD